MDTEPVDAGETAGAGVACGAVLPVMGPEVRPRAMELPFKPVPGESQLAFESFLCYFDIGTPRSCGKVAALMGVSHSATRRWSRQYKWQERLASYQEQMVRNRVQADLEAKRDVAAEWAERARAFKEREWATAEKLIRVVESVLDSFKDREPEEISLTEAARALEIASKLGRLATGLATEHNHTKAEIVSLSLEAQIQTAVQKIYGNTAPDAPWVES